MWLCTTCDIFLKVRMAGGATNSCQDSHLLGAIAGRVRVHAVRSSAVEGCTAQQKVAGKLLESQIWLGLASALASAGAMLSVVQAGYAARPTFQGCSAASKGGALTQDPILPRGEALVRQPDGRLAAGWSRKGTEQEGKRPPGTGSHGGSEGGSLSSVQRGAERRATEGASVVGCGVVREKREGREEKESLWISREAFSRFIPWSEPSDASMHFMD